MYEVELKQITIDFLKSKGVKDINELSQAKKDALMTEFFQLPQVINLLAYEVQSEVSFYSDFSGFKGKVQSKTGQAIGGVFSNVDKAMEAADKATTEAGKMLIGGNVKNPTGSTMIGGVFSNIGKAMEAGKMLIGGNVKNPTVPTMIGGNVKNPTVPSSEPKQTPPKMVQNAMLNIQEQIKEKQQNKAVEMQQRSEESKQLRDRLRAEVNLAQEKMSVGQKSEDNQSSANGTKVTAEKKKKTMLYIGIGAGVIVVAVVLFFVLRKK